MRAFSASISWRLAIVLVAILTVLLGEQSSDRAAAQAVPRFVVNSTADNDNPDGVLTLREALLVANGGILGGFTDQERAQMVGCTFDGGGNIVGGCGVGLADTIEFSASLGTSPTIALVEALPHVSDTAPTAIRGGDVRPIIDATEVEDDGLIVTSAGNTIEKIIVASAPRDGISVSAGGSTMNDVGVFGNGRHGILIDSGTGHTVTASGIGVPGLGTAACLGGNSGGGLYITGGAGATVTDNLIACNAGDGLSIDGGNLSTITGNFIGISPAGVVLPNRAGVAIFGASTFNTVGPNEGLGQRNVISGNTAEGVAISGAGAKDNLIVGNYIGVAPGGSVAAGNGAAGVAMVQGAGPNTARGNVISGNSREGVLIEGGAGNILQSNYIGINATGILAIPNGLEGVAVQSGANGTIVGGAGLPQGNVISGNAAAGVAVRDAETINTTIDGNRIGLDVSGTLDVGNGQAGVAIFEAKGTSIGGGGLFRQFISGNEREGIYLENAVDTVVGNNTAVGLASNAVTAMGNTREGIRASGATGTEARPGFVAYNGLAGIASSGGSNNRFIPLEVGYNGGVAIDLGAGAPAVPVITNRTPGAVAGTACANCTVLLYVAFENPQAPGGHGQYRLQVVADSNGAWTAGLPAGVPHNNISAMACTGACGATSSTSELSEVETPGQVRKVEFAVLNSTIAEGGAVTIQLKLTISDKEPLKNPVTVMFNTVNGTATAGQDYQAKSGTIAWLAGSKDGEIRTITINTFGDTVEDVGETFTITLASPTNAVIGSFGTHTVTIAAPGSGRPFSVVVPWVSKD